MPAICQPMRFIGTTWEKRIEFFRQDHGYQDGTYIKEWQGREDNEHLSELLDTLDATAAGFPEAVYDALSARYATMT